MEEKSVVIYKDSFITKIKNFFRKLFGKQEKHDSSIRENIPEVKKENFIDEVKIENPNEIEKVVKQNNFLEEIDGNEEALNNLSIDRLQKLEKYYDNIIEQNNEIIKRLKAGA